MNSSPEPLDLPVDLDLLDEEPHHPHGDDHDPVHDELERRIDPVVAEAVHSVRDRFGAHGLRDLISLAGYELHLAEQALASLRAEVVDAEPTAEDAAFDVPLASEPGDDDGGAGSR
jgi:hypothetical protein